MSRRDVRGVLTSIGLSLAFNSSACRKLDVPSDRTVRFSDNAVACTCKCFLDSGFDFENLGILGPELLCLRFSSSPESRCALFCSFEIEATDPDVFCEPRRATSGHIATCDPEALSTRPAELTSTHQATLDATTSSAQIRVNGATTEVPVHGEIALVPSRCTALPCDFEISHLRVDLPPFEIEGVPVTDGQVLILRRLQGTLLPGPATGLFVVPFGQEVFVVAGDLHAGTPQLQRAGGLFSLSIPMFGLVDVAQGTFFASLALEGPPEADSLSLVLSLQASFSNRVPVAMAGLDVTATCMDQGAAVTLDGTASFDYDGDGDIERYTWVLDPSQNPSLLGFGPRLSTTIPVGHNKVRLFVTDRSDAVSFDDLLVDVVDSDPPRIEAVGPLCLWPPNHKYALLKEDALREFVHDACDPEPQVVFVSGASNQDDDGFGDGNTTADIVVSEDQACLRVERDGSDLEGRSYSLEIEAVDSSGNHSLPARLELRVEHDQERRERCIEAPSAVNVLLNSPCAP